MTKFLHNPSVGEILSSEFMEPAELSPEALAKQTSLQASVIKQIIKGEQVVTSDIDSRLCKFFRLSKGYFLRLQSAHAMMQEKRGAGVALCK